MLTEYKSLQKKLQFCKKTFEMHRKVHKSFNNHFWNIPVLSITNTCQFECLLMAIECLNDKKSSARFKNSRNTFHKSSPFSLLFSDSFFSSTFNALYVEIRNWIFNFIISLPLPPNKSKHLSTSTRSINGFSQTLSCNFYIFHFVLMHLANTKSRAYEFLSILCMCIFCGFFYSKTFLSRNSLNICQRHRDKKSFCRNSFHVTY